MLGESTQLGLDLPLYFFRRPTGDRKWADIGEPYPALVIYHNADPLGICRWRISAYWSAKKRNAHLKNANRERIPNMNNVRSLRVQFSRKRIQRVYGSGRRRDGPHSIRIDVDDLIAHRIGRGSHLMEDPASRWPIGRQTRTSGQWEPQRGGPQKDG